MEIFTRNQIRQDGFYRIIHENETTGGLAFNYDRTESDMDMLSNEQLITAIQDAGLNNFSIIQPAGRSLSNVITEMNTGVRLWKLFILLALLFLLGEVLLLRIWK